MRIAIYARVSTDKQDTQNQLVQLRDFATKQGWHITREYVDDGISELKPTAGLNQMFADADRHRFDLVLFWALNRQNQVDGWNVIDEHHLRKTFKFPDFRKALGFVDRVGELAEEQGHHPDIFLAWGKVEITTWTHKINGLTESDFILAAKIDQLYKP